MISKWNYLPLTEQQQQIKESLAEELGISPVICELLALRGVKNAEEAQKFFSPQLSDLHDPFLMDGMKEAVERLNYAIGQKERILVYGDYDVDGTTAVALVYKYLKPYCFNIEYYIPDRYEEGYGISRKSIDYAYENGVKLIIALDCGIKAIDKVAYAKSKGIDFIICDHHVPDNELPKAAAILNPKLENSNYPYSELSGCGVGFKFMQGFAKDNGIDDSSLYPLLDFVALSIASDIVPITGENRILAYHGLKRLNEKPSHGLKGIINICGLQNKQISTSDIVFKIGPRINASGRMEQGKEAVDLLLSSDFEGAKERSRNINQYNEERKALDKTITEEANEILSKMEDLDKFKSIVIYNRSWKRGIIGIVASRLTELHYKPAVVLAYSNGIVTGSARSVQGFDIYKAIESCRDLLESFGGHTYAAGLSLKEERIPEFVERFEAYVKENIEKCQTVPQIDIDVELSFKEITPDLHKQIMDLAPFGPGNTKPVFFTRDVKDYQDSKLVGKDGKHIKLEMIDDSSANILNGIAFDQKEHFEHIKANKPFDICYTIEEMKYNNPKGYTTTPPVVRNQIQLAVKDIISENK
ncbi:MAG: single-stranded-DNA-specific exonuclease RecJ [Bacteroidales bacterium]|nr:single-stranded-DNA-specific exonuclease RecJ [Bacteroidales bacterium]